MTDKHEADLDRISTRNTYTDFTRTAEDLPQGGGLFTRLMNGTLRAAAEQSPYAKAVHDSTDFDSTDLGLNELLDLIEQSDPADLESSGKALWDARDAIKAAATELDGHINRVEWIGESGEAFRAWGGNLVTNTHHLSDYAGAAGDQITAAAVGLASVRGAMPSRDTEADRKRPHVFTEAEKVANKAEYTAAVKVEKDRQEAINQMNRLASYYSVSEEAMASLPVKQPEFSSMPDVGVPKPAAEYRVEPVSTTRSDGVTGPASPTSHHATGVTTGDATGHGTGETPTPAKHVPDRTTYPDIPVGTNIDSVGTLPPASLTPVNGHTSPVTGTPATGVGPVSGFDSGFGTPMPNAASSRNMGGGIRTPASAQGRVGTSGSSNSGRSAGRGTTNQMGRAAAPGQSAAKGGGTGAKSSPMGRGISGGTPRAGGASSSRATGGSATGAGRTNGVVGGRPSNAAGKPGQGGSKMPRGTIIGAEEAANSRSATSRPGQRGVFGAPESTGRPGSSTGSPRSGTSSSDGVTGSPAERNTAARAERNGMTRGGTGLVRGPAGHGKPGENRSAQRDSRPDYLTEDEETHLPTNPRRDVPPVIN
ncbi:hypothetical protein R6V09_19230 [Streptomyces sp. W16]|uniref:hypothetical protein n=1 Tax=Streptomyces sp. W16 TaxID=3076631 RepID=UPI00295A650D|nr:hypothetical protein [Streptomyces sp. W16]MDV9172232.1 hypothetical protein [Streptomyces sp. W16]